LLKSTLPNNTLHVFQHKGDMPSGAKRVLGSVTCLAVKVLLVRAREARVCVKRSARGQEVAVSVIWLHTRNEAICTCIHTHTHKYTRAHTHTHTRKDAPDVERLQCLLHGCTRERKPYIYVYIYTNTNTPTPTHTRTYTRKDALDVERLQCLLYCWSVFFTVAVSVL